MKALLERIKRALGLAPDNASHPESQQPPPADYGEENPAHGMDEDPEELHRGRRRLKETYTSHWDLDYLPREELEEVLEDDKKNKED